MSDQAEGSGIESLLALREQFVNYDAIPDEELARVSYKRIGPGHLVPIGIEATLLDRNTAWETKQARRPFDRIAFTVPTSSELIIDSKRAQSISKKLSELDPNWNQKIEDIVPSDSPINEFRKQYQNWNSSSCQGFKEEDYAYFKKPQDGRYNILLIFENESITMFCSELFDYLVRQIGEERAWALEELLGASHPEMMRDDITTIGLDNFFSVIDRARAKYADKSEEKKRFANIMEGKGEYGVRVNQETMQDVLEELPKQEKAELTKLGIDTIYGVANYYFCHYLRDQGLADIADSLGQAKSIEEAITILGWAEKDASQIRRLKDQIAEYKKQKLGLSPEKSATIDKLLKQNKDNLRQTRRIIRGMKDYFDLPSIMCDLVRRNFREIQKILKHAGTEGTISITLDARYDEQKDADPGELSGDCTEGRPLPFKTPDIPIYNVKVYENEQHSGNIYWLQTIAAENSEEYDGEPVEGWEQVWHLEAIQLPSYKIKWSEFVKLFLAAVEPIAKARGIKYITINNEPETTSNYDYISKAFIDFLGSPIGIRRLGIVFPPNPDNSELQHFQGDNPVYILWQNPDL